MSMTNTKILNECLALEYCMATDSRKGSLLAVGKLCVKLFKYRLTANFGFGTDYGIFKCFRYELKVL